MSNTLWSNCVGRSAIGVAMVAVLIGSTVAAGARDFALYNITDDLGGPGSGQVPSINDFGDVAFYHGTSVYFYDRTAGTFRDVTALPGAPTTAWFPKLNNLGNIVMLDATNRDLWLFEAATQTFTNISTLPGYPGNSGANIQSFVCALNDSNQISFHSGPNNNGQVWLYTHATGTFQQVTGQPGGATYGRQNTINNAGQVAYMGFPSLYIYDSATGITTNISTLPGGPANLADSFALNDRGDVAFFRPDEVTYYEASSGTFLYLSSLAGFPAGAASSYGNDLSARGEITFWRTSLYYFNPTDQSFTQLNNQGTIPSGGMMSSINNRGRIAIAAGLSSIEDIYVGTSVPQSDFDMDGDADTHDFALLQHCYSGPGAVLPGWQVCAADADYDGDDDVDMDDVAVFEAEFVGPGV